jgi:hypothetical protein
VTLRARRLKSEIGRSTHSPGLRTASPRAEIDAEIHKPERRGTLCAERPRPRWPFVVPVRTVPVLIYRQTSRLGRPNLLRLQKLATSSYSEEVSA